MLKVLIVEDNAGMAETLKGFLECGNYRVCGMALTVSEAVRMADFHRPDLAVFDYRMGNGEYGSQIRRRLKDKETMAILYASGDELQQLTLLDGEGYIQKPYQMQELLQAVSIVHGIKHKRDISALKFPDNFRVLPHPELQKAAL